MEFLFDFSKTKMSSKVLKFIEDNIPKDKEEDIKSVQRLLKGYKLAYKEANSVLEIVFAAIIFNDGEEDILIENQKEEISDKNDPPSENIMPLIA